LVVTLRPAVVELLVAVVMQVAADLPVVVKLLAIEPLEL
jgi:hypothetical protein